MDPKTLILILAPVIVLQLSLQVAALYDIWRHKGAKSNTLVWVLVVVFFQILGAAAYFVLGRKDTEE